MTRSSLTCQCLCVGGYGGGTVVLGEGGPNLCPVELQLIISDPPGLLGLQPLGSLLLHVVLPQPIGLDHLLKGLLTAGAQHSTAQVNTISTQPHS